VITEYSLTLGEPQTTFDLKKLHNNSFTVTVTPAVKSKNATATTTMSAYEAQMLTNAFNAITSGSNI